MRDDVVVEMAGALYNRGVLPQVVAQAGLTPGDQASSALLKLAHAAAREGCPREAQVLDALAEDVRALEAHVVALSGTQKVAQDAAHRQIEAQLAQQLSSVAGVSVEQARKLAQAAAHDPDAAALLAKLAGGNNALPGSVVTLPGAGPGGKQMSPEERFDAYFGSRR